MTRKHSADEKAAVKAARAAVERERRAAAAIAAGRVPGKVGNPNRNAATEDEKREKRRIKSAKWRAENIDKSRQIARDSMRRAAAERAVADGREPGKPGIGRQFTDEEKKLKRRAKANAYYAKNSKKLSARTAELQKLTRAGLYQPKPFRKLTPEEQRRVQVVMSQNRRARVRGAGGKFTRADVERMYVEQGTLCAWCYEPLGDDIHVDHYMPLALGGTNDPNNLRLLHGSCNASKGALHPVEFGRRYGRPVW